MNIKQLVPAIALITISIIALVWRGRMDQADDYKCGKKCSSGDPSGSVVPKCVQGGDTVLYILIVIGVIIGVLYVFWDIGLIQYLYKLIK